MISEEKRAQSAEDEELLYDWETMWARSNQIEPVGQWNTWLILAGRGFGKTRTGAEWVRARVERGARRVAILGRTSSDVRDVMIEGESGLMSVCPPWNKPRYEPSKRRLTWPSGAIATCFTADEPDMLRGPQFDTAWCLVGETRVTMADGSYCRLDGVHAGDFVMTRDGSRVVLGSAMTRAAANVYRLQLMDGRTIVGTFDHPVFSGGGFRPLGALKAGDECVVLASCGAGSDGTCTETTTSVLDSGFIERCGSIIAAKFRAGWRFITSMRTRPTTASKTYASSQRVSTCEDTSNIFASIEPKQAGLRSDVCQSYGTRTRTSSVFVLFVVSRFAAAVSMRAGVVAARVLTGFVQWCFDPRSVVVLSAAPLTLQQSACSVFVPSSATPRSTGARNEQSSNCVALAASAYSNQREVTPDSAPETAPLLSTSRVASVEVCGTANVYDIAVEGAREFFANDVLVHNCDELASFRFVEAWDNLRFGLRLGKRPRVCVTTTPRPTQIIKDLMSEKSTFVTTGSSYENKRNLAADFFNRILAKYEGTRLGMQEIWAKVLEDTPGALWTQKLIDEARVRTAPQLARVVVAIDPSVTSGEHSDEAGIVVAGIARVEGTVHGFVLDDLSAVLSPDSWARRAIKAYRDHKADRLVAEVNNGGDLVETTVRTIDKQIAYKAVRAARGKATRAEPIAALYEQGRVHHCGAFAKLESQMCTFVPGQTSKSPDRMDALVWALTELMLGESAEVPSGVTLPGQDVEQEWRLGS